MFRVKHNVVAFVVWLAGTAACGEPDCPSYLRTEGDECVVPGPVDAGTTPRGGDQQSPQLMPDAGDGGRTAAEMGGVRRAPAAGAQNSAPAIDPTVEWMCAKGSAGACTSCTQDRDCASLVCEHGYCMECRDTTQCDAAASCISNRCVPKRTPSSIWTTGGGGLSTASGFRMQLSIGTPSPTAPASAAGYQLSVASGAGSF
jgi:hypothetical protein